MSKCRCGHDEKYHHDGTGVWAKGCNQPIAMEVGCPCKSFLPAEPKCAECGDADHAGRECGTTKFAGNEIGVCRCYRPAEPKCAECGHREERHFGADRFANRSRSCMELACGCKSYRPPTTEPAESEEMPIDDLPPEANHDDDCPCRCCEAFRQELIESEQWEDDDED